LWGGDYHHSPAGASAGQRPMEGQHMFTVAIWARRGLWVVLDSKKHVVGEFFTQQEAREFASRCYRNLDRGYSTLVA
jgi:hypothetical protein